jgi:urea ABC transporter ATP-binding protein UrtE
MTLLSVRGLRAAYGRIPILHGIDLSVEQGSVIGVLGHNGMGKTTLLKAILGLLPATGGEVRFEARDLTREPAHVRSRLGIGYVAQQREIFPKLTVEENLRVGLLRLGGGKSEAEGMERILEEFPRLRALRARRGGVLSGGEQQILAIARSLAGNPKLLMLDEPTEGVQPSVVQEIVGILRQLRQTRNLSIILVEQKLDIIAALVDRTYVIQRGRISGEIAKDHIDDPDIVREFVGMGG